MKCKHCGREITTDCVFCPKCGQRIVFPAPIDKKENMVSSFIKKNRVKIIAGVSALISVVGIGVYSFGNSTEVYQNGISNSTDTYTVYVTPNGTKYHRRSCRYVKENGIAKKLSAVEKSYDPCKVCKP